LKPWMMAGLLWVAMIALPVGGSPADDPEMGWGTGTALGLNMAFTLEPLLQLSGAPLADQDDTFIALRSLTGAAVHLPLYAYDVQAGLAFTAIQAASAGLLWASVYPMDHNWFVGGPATLLQSQIGGMYANYEIYRHEQAAARHLAEPVGVSWLDMLQAQFSWDVMQQPWVWVPAALGLGISLATVPSDQAIWRTGNAYLGSWQMKPLFGTVLLSAVNLINYSMVGIGEEALYRGVIYEELSRRVGLTWAKILDAGLIFPLVHVPQYVSNGNSLESILMMYGFIATAGLVFDFAYDAGGLELSSAAHMWMDFFYYTAMGLQVFGAPLGDNKSNNQADLATIRLTPTGLQFSIAW